MGLDSTITKKIKYIGWESTFKKFDCKKELLELKDSISEIGSYEGEYYYLLGKSFENEILYNDAIEQYIIGRNAPVVDLKVLVFSKL